MLLVDGVFARDVRAAEKSIMKMDFRLLRRHQFWVWRFTAGRWSTRSNECEDWIGRAHWLGYGRTQGTYREERGRLMSWKDRTSKEKTRKGGKRKHNGADSWRREQGGAMRVGDIPHEMKDHNEDDMQPME
jgi:hypothetical protein